MAENEQNEKVAPVSPFQVYIYLVDAFVENKAKADIAKKLANGLKAAQKSLSDANVANVGKVTLSDITAALSELEVIEKSVSSEMRAQLTQSSSFVEQALETGLVPESDIEGAKAAMARFDANSVTMVAPVGKARARQTA